MGIDERSVIYIPCAALQVRLFGCTMNMDEDSCFSSTSLVIRWHDLDIVMMVRIQ
jgi:hypothetical protein